MTRTAFVTADAAGTAAEDWFRKVTEGREVYAAERNAFVAKSAGLMDVLARPGELLAPTGALRAPPSVTYTGPVSQWNGRAVPLVGSMQAPADWMVKGPLPARPRSANPFEPSESERRALWLALWDTQKSLAQGYSVVPEPRTAGALPVIAIVVIAVAGISALAVVLSNAATTLLREREETARHAQAVQAAAAEYVECLRRRMTQPGLACTDGPNQTRIRNAPAPGAPPPPGSGATDRALNTLAEGARTALLVGGVGLGASFVLPPLAQFLASSSRGRGGR